jgi:dTDP-4-dehydrorhamnose reductase
VSVVVVTGAGGQLGRAVVAAAEARSIAVVAADHRACDVADEAAVRRLVQHAAEIEKQLRGGTLGAVIHTAAWTDVDGCESDPERARVVNGEAAGFVAKAAAEHGARTIHVSTDFVFAGDRSDGCGYREDDAPAPVSEYGRSKALGEERVLRHGGIVARTAWVFGPGGKNFPSAILKRAREVGELRVVDDQTGCPTMTLDLADALLDLAFAEGATGIYHATNSGSCTWHAFAEAIVEDAGLGHVPVARMSSAELNRPARRPSWSVLDPGRLPALRGRDMPGWRDALRRYLELEGRADGAASATERS